MDINEEYKIRYDIVLKELMVKFDDEFESIELEHESNSDEELNQWYNGNIKLKINTDLESYNNTNSNNTNSTVHDEKLLSFSKKPVTWTQYICSFFPCNK